MSSKSPAAAASRDLDDNAEPVGVFVIDDHAGYRAVVGEVIAATTSFTVAGGAASLAAAQDELRRLPAPPDLLLIDVNLGDESGIEVARQLRQDAPCVKIILISTLSRDDLPEEARRCGASAFLPKSQLSPQEILRAWQGEYDWKQ